MNIDGNENEAKLKILSSSSDEGCATFSISEEDHTLANALRYMIMKNPKVEYCGYSIPHPTEAKVNIRVQTSEETTAVEAMNKGLDDLIELCEHILVEYNEKLDLKNYKYDEGVFDTENKA
ncbi:putative DNA-directed RNA polymerase subunit [Anaeromyces robustus]|uniref:DNA-directed RNA polymerases I and III subunit RPAC2 n=1 Tax=Anaeromyces robustus TaxID=1754192 RepID=A0A1Y1XML6_9FUNG|nr:putative DNA-directed RNA polymerase subunit [Anaeromyces robustus]|eukprot:ORX86971.1 putative DNA-directed RNA polymerase subunit [Anaeromyces robustus]